MERSETLRRLRGEGHQSTAIDEGKKNEREVDTWDLRHERFATSFIEKTSENAQRIILWCLAPTPGKRPTASELLKVSRLLVIFRKALPTQISQIISE
jgi:hypothetical protein